MTTSVTSDRSTLSLPGARLRSDQPTLRAGPDGITSRPAESRTAPAVTVARGAAMDGAALRAVALNLDRASSVADAGLAASGAIIDVLARLRDAASSGDGEGVRASRAALNETLQSGAFDGANLLDGSMPGGALRVAVGPADGGGITISGHDLRPGGPVVSLDPDAEGAQAAAQAEAAIIKVETAREQLREDSKRLEAHRSFLTMLSDAVGGEAKNLDVDGARLAALSIKQTIGGTTLALAGGAPQQVLSLFR